MEIRQAISEEQNDLQGVTMEDNFEKLICFWSRNCVSFVDIGRFLDGQSEASSDLHK